MRRRPWHLLAAVPLSLGLAACSDTTPVSTLAPGSTGASRSATSGGSRNVVVTSTISSDPTFQIKSDGLGVYKNSSTLESDIQSIFGDWVLDSYTLKNGTRTVSLDFSRPVSGTGPNGGDAVTIPSGLYKFHMIAKCHLAGNSFLTIAPGQTVQCPLHLGDIFVGGQQYGVTMNPGVTSSDETWPETNYANVKCNSTAGSCASWTLTPSATAADGSLGNVAALIKYVSSGTKGNTTSTPVKQGDFYMSFRIDVTNP